MGAANAIAEGSRVIRIKFERLNRGWSLLAASKRLGITDSTLCLIERQRLVPTDAMLRRLAEAYGVTPPAALLQDVGVRDMVCAPVRAEA